MDGSTLYAIATPHSTSYTCMRGTQFTWRGMGVEARRAQRCSRAHLGGGADGGRRHGERRNGTLEEGSDLLGGHLG